MILQHPTRARHNLSARCRRPVLRQGFTLVEILVVIAIIGVFTALLLPGLQATRESARRLACQSNLQRVSMGLLAFESSHGYLPAGSIEPKGPIQNLPEGQHQGWLVQLLPYLDYPAVYKQVDLEKSVYDPQHQAVYQLGLPLLNCPSNPPGVVQNGSNYAGCYHDVEAPIDESSHGVLIRNRRLSLGEIEDGASLTVYLGEKLVEEGDLGWMSGTRATLRNMSAPPYPRSLPPLNPPPDEELSKTGPLVIPQTRVLDADGQPIEGVEPEAPLHSLGNPARLGDLPPPDPLFVGTFASHHPLGKHFAFGDGQVRFLSNNLSATVARQLGHRSDGELPSISF